MLGDRVEIVPTVNVPQGLAALVAFDPELEIDINVNRMTHRLDQVTAGAVTKAVRDSMVEDRKVAAGKFIGVVDSRVLVDGEDIGTALLKMVQTLLQPEHEMISLYYGANLKETEAQELAEKVGETFSDIEIQVYPGGQPYYHFIISIE